jgi:hypothetical protein
MDSYNAQFCEPSLIDVEGERAEEELALFDALVDSGMSAQEARRSVDTYRRYGTCHPELDDECFDSDPFGTPDWY